MKRLEQPTISQCAGANPESDVTRFPAHVETMRASSPVTSISLNGVVRRRTTRRIVVRLAGGLGNQLFQFAASVRLADQVGLPLSSICLDTRFLAGYATPRRFELGFVIGCFPGVQVAGRLPSASSMVSRFRLARILDRRVGALHLISSIAQLKAAGLVPTAEASFVLDGYFQHPDALFSAGHRDRVRARLLEAKQSLVERVIGGAHAVGIHIRRGDFLKSGSASGVFRTIPLAYYETALRRLRRSHTVLVFSDDPELSAHFAAKVSGVDIRQYNLSLDDEFVLLMACRTLIIANSTFSWWAAYLGYGNDSRVIVPERWYNVPRNNHLLLDCFERLDV